MLQWGRARMGTEGVVAIECTGGGMAALQWGRARMGTEGHARTPEERAVIWLQWGRARMGTEGSCRQSLRSGSKRGFNGAVPGWARKAWSELHFPLPSYVASMGPCPDGHGRKPRSGGCPGGAGLQWGRARMGTEGCLRVCGRYRRQGASMGPCPDGHGRAVDQCLLTSCAQLQWGRARMGTEGCQ